MTRRSALLGAAVAVALVLLPRLNSGPRPSLSAQQVAVVGHLSRLPAVAGLLDAAPSTTTTSAAPARPPVTVRASRSAPRRPLPPTAAAPTTVPPPAPVAPQTGAQTAVASWYSLGRGAGACGQRCAYAYPYTFAHLTMPFGTRIQFCHDGRCIIATCSDRGPYVKGRLFDLSAETAAAIDPAYRSDGIITVTWSAA